MFNSFYPWWLLMIDKKVSWIFFSQTDLSDVMFLTNQNKSQRLSGIRTSEILKYGKSEQWRRTFSPRKIFDKNWRNIKNFRSPSIKREKNLSNCGIVFLIIKKKVLEEECCLIKSFNACGRTGDDCEAGEKSVEHKFFDNVLVLSKKFLQPENTLSHCWQCIAVFFFFSRLVMSTINQSTAFVRFRLFYLAKKNTHAVCSKLTSTLPQCE
jgi:hypothetical protein